MLRMSKKKTAAQMAACYGHAALPLCSVSANFLMCICVCMQMCVLKIRKGAPENKEGSGAVSL